MSETVIPETVIPEYFLQFRKSSFFICLSISKVFQQTGGKAGVQHPKDIMNGNQEKWFFANNSSNIDKIKAQIALMSTSLSEEDNEWLLHEIAYFKSAKISKEAMTIRMQNFLLHANLVEATAHMHECYIKGKMALSTPTKSSK